MFRSYTASGKVQLPRRLLPTARSDSASLLPRPLGIARNHSLPAKNAWHSPKVTHAASTRPQGPVALRKASGPHCASRGLEAPQRLAGPRDLIALREASGPHCASLGLGAHCTSRGPQGPGAVEVCWKWFGKQFQNLIRNSIVLFFLEFRVYGVWNKLTLFFCCTRKEKNISGTRFFII